MAGSGNVELANYFNIMTEVKKKTIQIFIYLYKCLNKAEFSDFITTIVPLFSLFCLCLF